MTLEVIVLNCKKVENIFKSIILIKLQFDFINNIILQMKIILKSRIHLN